MTTPDPIVDQLAATLTHPIHPEAGPILYINHQTFPGQDDEQQAAIATFTRTSAEAIIHTLDERGYQIVHKNQLAQPPTLGTHPQITLACEACGTTQATTTADPHTGRATIPHRGLPPCTHCHPTSEDGHHATT